MKPWVVVLTAAWLAGCSAKQDLGEDRPDAPGPVDLATLFRCTLPQAGWPVARGRADGSALGHSDVGALAGEVRAWQGDVFLSASESPAVTPAGLVLVSGVEPRAAALQESAEEQHFHLYALRPDGGGLALAWKNPDAYSLKTATVCQGEKAVVGQGTSILAVRLSDGASLGKSELGHRLTTSFVPAADLLVAGAEDGVVAVRPDGSLAWFHATEKPVIAQPAARPDGSVLVAVAYDGPVLALGAADGAALWGFQRAGNGNRNGPGVVALGDGGALTADLHAVIRLDAGGREAWRWSTEHVVTATPSVAADGGARVPTLPATIYGLSDKGEALWSVPSDESTDSVSGVAVGVDGAAVGGTYPGGGNTWLLRGDGSVGWSLSADAGTYATPALADGVAYWVVDGGSLMIAH